MDLLPPLPHGVATALPASAVGTDREVLACPVPPVGPALPGTARSTTRDGVLSARSRVRGRAR